MSNEEHECGHDECGLGEGDYRVTVDIEFDVKDEADDMKSTNQAMVRTHLHGIPPQIAAGALLKIAQQFMTEALAHDEFAMLPPPLAHAMAKAAADAYLINAIRDDIDIDVVPMIIPDDARELTGE